MISSEAVGLFLALFLGAFASEDASVITSGVLIASGNAHPFAAALGAFSGILVSDLSLVWLGRAISSGAAMGWLGRFAPKTDAVESAGRWFGRHGLWVLVASRFLPGTRAATSFAAGYLRLPLRSLIPAFTGAALVWTVFVISLIHWLGESTVLGLQVAWLDGAPWLVGALLLLVSLVVPLRNRRRRILIRAALWRMTHFEFWPRWACYLPVYLATPLWALRHRSWTLWTAANPGIELGGLVGESKAGILEKLDRAGAPVARWQRIPQGTPELRTAAVVAFARGVWPVVLKPDVGERGNGVAIVRSVAEADSFLRGHREAYLVQDYLHGEEFGILYERRPGSSSGRVRSLQGKQLPCVVGDGTRALSELILEHPRGPLMWEHFSAVLANRLEWVPQPGVRVPLTEVGNHCKGAVFLDRRDLATPALVARMDVWATRVEGFNIGRFDVRAPSEQALARGEFILFELNGVASEPGHIYDPKGSVWAGWYGLLAHWAACWRLGAINVRLGFRPAKLRDVLEAIRSGS